MRTISRKVVYEKNLALEKIAKKVLNNMQLPTEKEYSIDPITIILVISVILTLIRVIQECRKNRKLIKDKNEYVFSMKKDIQEAILKDSWLNRLRLQRIIKQNLSKDQYKAYGKALQYSIMGTGINLTEDEVYTLMEAANDA
jgi:cell division protein FtsL